MNTRRRFLTAGGAAVAVALSGCSDAIEVATEEEIERSAVAVEPNRRTVEDEGFEEIRRDTETIEEEVEEFGQRREITLNSEVRAYSRDTPSATTEYGESVVAVVSTPGVTIAGQQLSPLASMDEEDVIEEARSEISGQFDGEVRDPELLERVDQSILDETVEVSIYEATVVSDNGAEADAQLHLAIVEHGDDVVLLAGAYPAEVDGERERVERLFEAME